MRYWKPKRIIGRPLVSIVAACYFNKDPRRLAAFGALVHSFCAQTYDHWELLAVHDGPALHDPGTLRAIEHLEDAAEGRLRWLETPKHKGDFGHPYRAWGIGKAKGDYIGLANDDGFYAPVYLEWLLHILTAGPADFVYCDLVHSHHSWRPFKTRPRKSHLDLGAWLARAALVKSTPWTDTSFAGDGTFINALVARCKRVEKVGSCLFMHN